MWKPSPDNPIPPGWEQTDTTRDTAATIRRYWWVPIAVAVVAVVVVSVASNDDSSDDNVHPAVADMVDTLKADRDCTGLQEAFDRHDEVDTLRYIDDALRDAGCYDD